MRKMVIFMLVVFTLIMAGTVYAKEVKEVPFTLDDRDRLIRVETKELEEREALLEKALKEYAQKEPKLAEILKSVRLL